MDKEGAKALNTSLAAGRILSVGAQRLSASLDMFSGWLLAGFGAVFGLMMANLQSATQVIDPVSLKFGAAAFLAAAAFAACQKLFAAFVMAGAMASADGRAIGRELAEGIVDLDVENMYQQVHQGLFWPWSRINRKITKKATEGDYAIVGRTHAKASQIQCYLVVIQVLFSLVAAAIVVCGILI